jgi:hypothetical protein
MNGMEVTQERINLLNNINRMQHDKEYRDEIMSAFNQPASPIFEKLSKMQGMYPGIVHNWEPL